MDSVKTHLKRSEELMHKLSALADAAESHSKSLPGRLDLLLKTKEAYPDDRDMTKVMIKKMIARQLDQDEELRRLAKDVKKNVEAVVRAANQAPPETRAGTKRKREDEEGLRQILGSSSDSDISSSESSAHFGIRGPRWRRIEPKRRCTSKHRAH